MIKDKEEDHVSKGIGPPENVSQHPVEEESDSMLTEKRK